MIESVWLFINHYLFLPLIVLAGLLVLTPLLNRVIRKKLPGSQFGYWLSIYSYIIFILTYYQGKRFLTYPFISFGKFNVNLNLLIVSFFVLTLAYHLSKALTKQFLPTVYSRYHLDIGIQYTFNRLFHYVVMIIAVLVTTSMVGLDLSVLTVFAGVLGVGIGFGLQNITSNFISGIILLFERPIKVGDRVIVEVIIGDVEKINMRATIIRSINNEHIIVPNSYFLEEHVVNRSYAAPEMRLVVPVGVSYDSNVDKVAALLMSVAEEESNKHDTILTTPEPFVNFVGFGESSLDFELFVWIQDPKQYIRIKSSVNFNIFRTFNQHDIEIPFPQRDLHVRSIDETLLNGFKKH